MDSLQKRDYCCWTRSRSVKNAAVLRILPRKLGKIQVPAFLKGPSSATLFTESSSPNFPITQPRFYKHKKGCLTDSPKYFVLFCRTKVSVLKVIVSLHLVIQHLCKAETVSVRRLACKLCDGGFLEKVYQLGS